MSIIWDEAVAAAKACTENKMLRGSCPYHDRSHWKSRVRSFADAIVSKAAEEQRLEDDRR